MLTRRFHLFLTIPSLNFSLHALSIGLYVYNVDSSGTYPIAVTAVITVIRYTVTRLSTLPLTFNKQGRPRLKPRVAACTLRRTPIVLHLVISQNSRRPLKAICDTSVSGVFCTKTHRTFANDFKGHTQTIFFVSYSLKNRPSPTL